MSSSELPREIIIEIVQFFASINPTKELCQLRLVSKYWNNLTSPLVFSTLHLEFKDAARPIAPNSTRCQETIIALATRSTTVFDHTTKLYLSLKGLYPAEQFSYMRTLLLDKIFDAICALKNLRTVHWLSNTRRDPDVSGEVMNALGTLPLFQGFEDIKIIPKMLPSFTLKPLSNLTIFRIQWGLGRLGDLLPEIASLLSRCPEMTELSLRGYNPMCGRPGTLSELFSKLGQLEKPLKLQTLELHNVEVTPSDIQTHLDHLKYLTCLEIIENPSPKAATAFGGICNVLQQRDIILRNVSTDRPEDPLFLSHFSSFSGLTSLRMVIPIDEDGDSEAVNQLYTQVLPKHAETLEHLKIGWDRPLTKEQSAGLIRCQKLRRIEVYTHNSYEGLERGDVLTFDMWYEAALQLSNLTNLCFETIGNITEYGDVGKLRTRYGKERGMKFRIDVF